jgi:hypothetical protein
MVPAMSKAVIRDHFGQLCHERLCRPVYLAIWSDISFAKTNRAEWLCFSDLR